MTADSPDSVNQTSVRFIVGHALSVLRSMPEGSVDMVLTSPPYFTLRSYLPDDHPDKALEIGQEPTPGEFLESLLTVMDEAWRVLTPDGTFWVNLGDTHAGSGGHDGEPGDLRPGGIRREAIPRSPGTERKARRERAYSNDDFDGGPLRDRQVDEDLGITPRRLRTRRTLPGYPLDQSVCWLPSLFGASLAYGRNLLTGVEHPPVGHETGRHVVQAVGDAGSGGSERAAPLYRDVPGQRRRRHNVGRNGKRVDTHELGAPPFNWWVVSTTPYSGAHFATFPPDLCVRPVLAGSPPGGVVLDPFAGTGVTGRVALDHGRSAVLIDLDAANADLARRRVGMFLDVQDHRAGVQAS